MVSKEERGISDAADVQAALIVSEVRFLCDGLIEVLKHVPGICSCEAAASLAGALKAADIGQSLLILLDAAFPGGPEAVYKFRAALPNARVIALGVRETEEDVLAWAEAGIAGYIPNTSSVLDLVTMIGQIQRGEQTCPASIAGTLLRRVAESRGRSMPESEGLTRRELQVLDLVTDGMSNKEIARRLRISLSTTKSHVHHVLNKLHLQRRANVMARMRSIPSAGSG